MSTDKPTEIDAIQAGLDEARARVRTLIPATIIAYTDVPPLGPVATVQVVRMAASKTGQPFAYPPIVNCPVMWPRAGGMAIWGTLLPGDEVMLGVADRSMDEFVLRPPLSPPLPQSDTRMHSLSDCVVILGLSSRANALPPAVNTFTVGREDGTATVKFNIIGPGQVSIEGVTIQLGVGALEPVTLASSLQGFLASAATTAATAAASTPGDGGAGAFTAFSTAMASLAATAGALKVTAE